MARFRKSVDLSAYENNNRKKPQSLHPKSKQAPNKRKSGLLSPRGRAISEGAGFIIPKHNYERESLEEKRRAIIIQKQQKEIERQKAIQQRQKQQKEIESKNGIKKPMKNYQDGLKKDINIFIQISLKNGKERVFLLPRVAMVLW